MERRASLAAVVASAACFATLAVLAQLAYAEGALPLPLLAWRFALVTVLMATYLALRSPLSLRVSARELRRFATLSVTGYGTASMCFFFALRHAPAGVVAVLLYTYPALVALGVWLFTGERPSRSRLAAVATTFAGCALVIDPFSASGRIGSMGIALGLGAAAGYAAFSVLSHRWLGAQPRLVLMTYTFGMSAVAAGAAALLSGAGVSPAGWNARVWGLLGAIVLIPTFAAVVLYLGGIRGLGAPQAAIVSTFEPVFTILLAWMLLGERLSAVQWAGAALVLGGVVTAELGRGRAEGMAAV